MTIASDSALPGGPLYFIHIPKTAGTSARTVLVDQYSQDELLFLYEDQLNLAQPDQAFVAGVRPRLPRVKIVFGHYYYGIHGFLETPPRYMAILREPVARVVSFYNDQARDPERPYYNLIRQGMTLADFVYDCVDYQVNNLMTRMIAGVKERDDIKVFSQDYLQRAFENIRRDFFCLGTVDSLEKMLSLLAQGAGWRPYTLPRLNVDGSYAAGELDARTRDLIEEYNRLDIELYRRYLDPFYVNLSLCPQIPSETRSLRVVSVNQEAPREVHCGDHKMADRRRKTEAELLDLPFDQYARYRDVKEVVDRFRNGSQQLKILDIGGGEGGYPPAPDFFPTDAVLVADLHKLALPNYLRASGLSLPFRDGAFDVVFSCDTLEHVPRQKRKEFIREMFRVARHLVILAAPFRSTVNELADHILQGICTKENGRPNQALVEHAECGLPDLTHTQALLKEFAAQYVSFPSGNIRSWLIMNSVLFAVAPIAKEIELAANHLYNRQFYDRDHSLPAYRICNVAAKTEADADCLDRLRSELPQWFSAAEAGNASSADAPSVGIGDLYLWQRALDAFRQTFQAFEGRDRRLQEVMQQIAKAEGVAKEKDDLIQRLKSEVAALECRVDEQTKLASETDAEAEKLTERLAVTEGLRKRDSAELERLQESLAGRVVQAVWIWRMRWFPFGSNRAKIYRGVTRRIARLVLGPHVRVPGPNGDSPAELIPASSATPATRSRKHEIVIHSDEPKKGDVCGGLFMMRGWAVASDGVGRVEIQLDGQRLGYAECRQPRADVGLNYPDFVDSENAGFYYLWDSRPVDGGPHVITVCVESVEGKKHTLNVPIVLDHNVQHTEYERWISKFEPSPGRLKEMADEASSFAYQPLVSIVVPVYRTPTDLLRSCIESVRDQVYTKWELCLADDGSKNPELTEILREYTNLDSRIKFTELPANRGISAATNAALTLATGEYVGLLDHDDLLAPDALYWVVNLLNEHRDADLIYSDEDKLDLAGNRCDYFFKPDWSPDLFLCINYACHFLVVRRRLIDEVGGYRSDFDGGQDYDLILRLWEKTKRIHHIPHILYHWRAVENSTAFVARAKPEAHVAAKRAIEEYFRRNTIQAQVGQGCALGNWIVRYEVLNKPKVAVLMPTGGNLQLLRPCLEHLLSKTDYPHYQLVLIDNSRGSAVQKYAEVLAKQKVELQYLDYRGKPFNYSAMNNHAARQVSSEMLLFLNDDTTVVNRDWLTALVEQGQRPTVGVVGAKLLYPAGTIQHAGVVMGVSGNCDHVFRNVPGHSQGYFGFIQMIRDCSAVTAACMLTRRDLFLQMNGFDEENLAVAFQDVDYCLRLGQAGYQVVYTPLCVLIHHESVTKVEKVPVRREIAYMKTKWADVIANDPFYNPNLTRSNLDYGLRWEFESPARSHSQRLGSDSGVAVGSGPIQEVPGPRLASGEFTL